MFALVLFLIMYVYTKNARGVSFQIRSEGDEIGK